MADTTYDIEILIQGGLTTTQAAAFDAASTRWSTIVVADVPTVVLGDREIDDCLITAEGAVIDGPSGILGQAGPREWRPDSLLPAFGIMQFDTADLMRMELDGSLENVVFHEMGHVLGIGTLWRQMGLLNGAGSINPVFTGPTAMAEFARLLGEDDPRPVPVANTGGPGTRDGHWRESVFGNELMTGILNTGPNPLSRVTIAAMQDMGYTVDLAVAEPYELPSQLDLALMGVGAIEHPQGCMMAGTTSRR